VDNFLTYFMRSSGAVLYRGLEMAQHARMLTSIAQCCRYTNDTSLPVKHTRSKE
jgi:hypothetical protein